MAGIHFRGRKDHESLDSSFSLFDGNRLGDVSSWHVGDSVYVCFTVTQEQTNLIRDNTDVYVGGGLLQIRCVVVSRNHSIIWKDIGRFESLATCSVLLEAESGVLEDVLRFIIFGQIPTHWSDSEKEKF